MGNKKPASTFILSNRELRKAENPPPGGTERAAGTVPDNDVMLGCSFPWPPALEVSTLKLKDVNYLLPGLLNREVQQ